MVQSEMVGRERRRSLLLPLRTQNLVKGPRGWKPVVKFSRPRVDANLSNRVPVVEIYCGVVRSARGTGR